ncbi:formate dehydrogenase subunit delta [Altererythrobacter atlanticus]|uniref:NADH-dependent formate dehydrogenase delta subunit FdsD n=1 Tax=Croceibacterium atlanticum TaxID=1267766 RepID=A0A0F7KX51_9SPHN|nr:formate dehydrogenase subunit delta [Croceibacterium atlanticum]AKH43802.1 NADH-dependent formate dehydrogenase delta subunit FdsD [Croceibacterium atlanticum]MBB5733748.1 formate dehydrogenase subunit delta [Croceibacterium atlanticum]
MSTAKLRRMADQIGANFAAIGHDNAVLATADHINKFWDPRMKAQIFADDHAALSPIARAAIEKLAAGANPPPQSPATEFNKVDEVGHSDAG